MKLKRGLASEITATDSRRPSTRRWTGADAAAEVAVARAAAAAAASSMLKGGIAQGRTEADMLWIDRASRDVEAALSEPRPP